MLLLMQPFVWSPFITQGAYSWLMLNVVSARIPKPFPAELSPCPCRLTPGALSHSTLLMCRRRSHCQAQGTATFGAPLGQGWRCWLRQKASFTRKKLSELNQIGKEKARVFQTLQMPSTKSVLVRGWFCSQPYSTWLWLFLAFGNYSFPLQIL